MRFAKWLLIAVLGLSALVIAGALLITQFIDPNRFKPDIAAAVKGATGRDLQLRGPLRLSWLPRFALQSSDGALDGSPDMAPVVSWRSARFGAALLPLIGGALKLDRIELDGLTLNLRRDVSGAGNWEALLQRLGTPGGDGGPSLREIAGVSLRDATLNYRAADGSVLQLTHWKLETGRIAAAAVVNVDTSFDLLTSAAAVPLPIALKAAVSKHGDAVELESLAARVSLGLGAAPATDVTLRSAALRGNLAQQTYQMPEAELTGGGATLRLTGAQLQFSDAGVQASAQFTLPVTSLRQLLNSAGVQAPHTRDPAALQRFAASGRMDYSPQAARISFVTLQLDDTRLSGSVNALRDPDVVEFSFAGDSMQLDRYRSPVNEPSDPFVFPTAKLAALRARGTLTLQRAQVAEMDLRGVTLRLLLADGRVQDVVPATAKPAQPAARKPTAARRKSARR